MRPKLDPIDEIRFAAKTGFLSKDIWKKFFAPPSKSWQSRRWRSFVKSKVFVPHPSSTAKDVLVLNPDSKLVISTVQRNFSCPPFVAQLQHDEIAAIGMQRLLNEKVISRFFTESEQRRMFIKPEDEIDRTKKAKYPDGVLRIGQQENGLLLALEIELTRKSRKRYLEVFTRYESLSMMSGIVFITGTSGIFRGIHAAMKEHGFNVYRCPVGFCNLEDWQKSPLTAPIKFDSWTTTIAKINQKKALR